MILQLGKWVSFAFVAITVFKSTETFQIIYCNSNYIDVIKSSDNNKATIKYDPNKNKISFNDKSMRNGKVKLWCESDYLFDKCVLTHKSEDPSNSTNYCTISQPFSCSQHEVTCVNKNIKYSVTSGKKCEFTFEEFHESGRYYYMMTSRRKYI